MLLLSLTKDLLAESVKDETEELLSTDQTSHCLNIGADMFAKEL